jgi:hypothetical protein
MNRLDDRRKNLKPLVDYKFFNNEWWKDVNSITELSYIEKIMYIAIPVVIFLNLVYYIGYVSSPNLWNDNLRQFFGNISLTRLNTIIIILTIFLYPLAFFLLSFFQDPSDFILRRHPSLLLKQKQTN